MKTIGINLTRKRNVKICISVMLFVVSTNVFAANRKDAKEAQVTSIYSVVGQTALITGALMLPKKYNPNHLFTSVALMVPPATPFYTQEWDKGTVIIGLGVLAGSMNYMGYALIDNSRKNEAIGTIFIGAGFVTKITAVVLDIVNARKSAKKYNQTYADDQTKFAVGRASF